MTKSVIYVFLNKLSGGGAERQWGMISPLLVHTGRWIIHIGTTDSASPPPDKSVAVTSYGNLRGLKLWNAVQKHLAKIKPQIGLILIPASFLSVLPIYFIQRKMNIVGCMRSAYRINSMKRLLQAFGYLFVKRVLSNVHPADMNFPYRQIYYAKDGRYIPNAVRKRDEGRVKESLPGEVKKILFVGRLIKDKNIDTLIQGINMLSKEGDFQLHIYGNGPEGLHLKNLCNELNVGQHIHFNGYSNNIVEVMNRSDLLVLPSTREGMPNVVFEAIQQRLPVAVSDIPVHRRWIKHHFNGCTFNPDNVEELVESIRYILTSDNGVTLAQNALELLEDLSLENISHKYDEFFLSMINE